MRPIGKRVGDTIFAIDWMARPTAAPDPMSPVDTPPPDPPIVPEPPPASLRQVAGAVFWSFFGVRKGKDMQHDAVTIRPLHLIIVGVLSGLVFVLALVGLVSLITRKV